MSEENSDSERGLESSKAEENGSDGFHNGHDHVESLIDGTDVPAVNNGAAGRPEDGEVMVVRESVDGIEVVNDGAADRPEDGEVLVVRESVDGIDVVNQDPSPPQERDVDQNEEVLLTRVNSVPGASADVKVTEDGGREDMFVDCPDELVVYDGRNADNMEALSVPTIEQTLEEKDDEQETVLPELDKGSQVHDLMNELKHLKDILEKTVSEKESLTRAYEEERGQFIKEHINIYHQLKALNEQRSSLDENDGEWVVETGGRDEKPMVPDFPLHETLNDCTNFLNKALSVRSHNERKLKDLQTTLLMKDQEIDNLQSTVNELSVNQGVIVSFLRSAEECWSQSLKESFMVQLEKDEYIEASANRVLTSLATTVNQEVLDESVTGKVLQLERSTSLLIGKYNQFLSEINLLGQCLTECRPDLSPQDEFQTIFSTARDELLDLKRKEADMTQKMSHLEDENRKLVQELDKDKGMVEMANTEIDRLKVELEKEKTKFANSKEKLSLAVTKGKALIQQRDSLKQSLTEKTSELERRMVELQEKSNVLEAAELSKVELVKSINLADSLQETLLQRDAILDECEQILSQSGIPEELQSVDIAKRIQWLVDEKNVFKEVSIEFHKLRDVLSEIQLPENVLFSDLESRVSWLVESFYQAQAEAIKLQDEIARSNESATISIDRLTTSFLVELQETYYLRKDQEDLWQKYEEIVEKERQVSLEKDQMINMLLEASGISTDNQEEIYNLLPDMSTLIDQCFNKEKEQRIASFELSHEAERFDHLQTLVYTSNQELVLYEKILEEEMLDRLMVNNLSNDLRLISEELEALKDEKGSLHKDLERAEEKSALLREKLSMAVKKGKGLVQERENMKQRLNEKNAEIETLKIELQEKESSFNECRDQLNKLSVEVAHIPKLEGDLVAMKDQKDQMEQFLVESNTMLQRMTESIDGIILPVDLTFEEPIEKVKWVAGYLKECQVAKTQAEQELGKIEIEVNTLATKLAEAYKTMKSMEDTLTISENNCSHLAEEMRELEAGKSYLEQELERAMSEASSEAAKFAEICATTKMLQDALSESENKISLLINEREDARMSRDAAETGLEKVKEEFSVQTSKLSEAYRTIKSLEDGLTQVETNVSLISAENINAQVVRTSLENEMKKMKEETDFQASKFADACSTIKSLEDALLKAQHSISELLIDKRDAEEDISTLNSKINACMEELAGTHGSLESRSLELSGHLNSFQVFLKDGTLLSLLRRCFERNFENLKNMDSLFKDMERLPNSSVVKGEPFGLDDITSVTTDINELNAADGGNILSNVEATMEGFHLRDKILADKVEHFSSLIDESIAVLSKKLQVTMNDVMVMFEQINSLKEKVSNLEVEKQAQENTIIILERDISVLSSACLEATKELDIDVESNLEEINSCAELGETDCSLLPGMRESGGDATSENRQRFDHNKYLKTAEKLLFAARKVGALTRRLEENSNESAFAIESLQNLLKETRTSLDVAFEERDSNQTRVFELENDVKELQKLCSEMSFKLEEYQKKDYKPKEREVELSSPNNMPVTKENEAEEVLLSAFQVKVIFDKINGLEIPFSDDETESHDSIIVKKLFYILENASAMQHRLHLLSADKKELQSSLMEQDLEIEQLKKEVEEQIRNKQDYENMRIELMDLMSGLVGIIKKLGGLDLIGDEKSSGARGLISALEKLVLTNILESDTLKSKAQELGAKLHGSQRVVDELSTKVKLLQDSTYGMAVSPDIVQERSVFGQPSLPTRSEISEVEDVGSNVKMAISSAPSAAHVRTLRKGSSEHLAINIDSESNRLINSEETDEDKGHIFKSLNTTGLIPRQGKMTADKIDGIWVSGGRALMSRPRARLGLIAYWLVLHIWLLGTIL